MSAPTIDPESQQALIGCALLGSTSAIIDKGINEETFLDNTAKAAWKAIETLNAGNHDVNSLAVMKAGGVKDVKWLIDAENKAPVASNYNYWVPRVIESARKYSLWALCNHTANCAGSMNSEEVAATLESGLARCTSTMSAGIEDSTKDGWKQVCDILAGAGSTDVTGIESGIESVDQLYKGLRKGSMNTIAGRPGAGKSALAASIAVNVAKGGGKVVVFTAEMAAREYQLRLLGNISAVDVQYYLKSPSRGDGRKLADLIPSVMKLPITIVDSPSITAPQIRAYCRKAAKGGAELIIVDYLQLYSSGRRTKAREEEVAAVSRILKQTAMESDVPIISLCQMNRAIENRQVRKPSLSDLRESGSIEQDSDTVAFVVVDENDREKVHFYLEKNRNGPPGVRELTFNTWCGRFS